MEVPVFIAKILGPYCVVVVLGVLFNLKTYKKILEDFYANTALVYLGGALAFVIGLVVVLVHNVWVADWTVIITIFGWMSIVKGIFLLIFPKAIIKFSGLYRNTALLVIHLFLVFALGAALTYFSYFAG